jgi:hypothetical protein
MKEITPSKNTATVQHPTLRRGCVTRSAIGGKPGDICSVRGLLPLTQNRRTWRNRSRLQGSLRRVNSFFDSVRAQTFQRIRKPLFVSGVAPLGLRVRDWSPELLRGTNMDPLDGPVPTAGLCCRSAGAGLLHVLMRVALAADATPTSVTGRRIRCSSRCGDHVSEASDKILRQTPDPIQVIFLGTVNCFTLVGQTGSDDPKRKRTPGVSRNRSVRAEDVRR